MRDPYRLVYNDSLQMLVNFVPSRASAHFLGEALARCEIFCWRVTLLYTYRENPLPSRRRLRCVCPTSLADCIQPCQFDGESATKMSTGWPRNFFIRVQQVHWPTENHTFSQRFISKNGHWRGTARNLPASAENRHTPTCTDPAL